MPPQPDSGPRRTAVAPVALALALGAGAAGLSAAATGLAPVGPPVSGAALGALLVVLTVTGALQVQLHYGDEVDASDLFDVALAPVMFVLAPPVAVLLTAAAKAVSQAVLQVPPVKALFNVAQWAAAAAAGTLVLAAVRAAGHPDVGADLLALALALTAVAAVNHAAVVAVLRLVAGKRPVDRAPPGISAAQPSRRWLYAGAFALNVCCGLLLAVAFRGAAVTIVVALGPLIVLHQAQRLAAARSADLERVDELRAASHALLVDDPRQALPAFLDRVRDGLGADAVELVLGADDDEPDGRLTVHRVTSGQPDRQWHCNPNGEYAALLELDDVLLVPPDPLGPALAAWLRRSGHHNVLTAPGHRPGGRRATLVVYGRTGLRGFGANLRQVSEALTRELSGALARSDLLRRVEGERSRFAALVRGSSDLVLVVDRYGTVRYASEAARRVVDRDPGELVGRPLSALFAPHQSGAIAAWLARTAGDPAAAVPLELELPVPGQPARHVETVARNLLDDPAVGGIVVNTRDVSERRHAQTLAQRQADILQLIATDAPLTETLQLIAATVEELLPAACCVVQLGTGPTAFPGTSPDGDGYRGLARALSDTLRLQQQAAAGDRSPTAPVVLADLAAAADTPVPPTLRRQLFDAGIAACWSWPLTLTGETHPGAALTVLFDRERRPTAADRRLVELAATLAGNAIVRTRERDRLAYQATHDALTGLASRAVLHDHTELALARMRRSATGVAVLFADLDNFKIINDSLGHRVGDALLQEISRRLLTLVRPADTVARLGGDEFVLLCADLPGPDGADAVAQRLLTVLADPVHVAGHEFFVTASVGVAVASGPEHPPDLLIEDADAAMYRAKAKGGNRYQTFDDTMRTAAARHLATRTSLRQALDQHDLHVHYQPTVDLTTGRLRGVEALVRWEHPTRGLLPPAEFIPLAEETGLIVPLGALVLAEACQQAARWQARHGGAPLELSVNLSPRQFAAGDLVDMVERALGEAGLDAASLSLEITETCLMEDAVDIRQALKNLKEVGVRLAIDDFGTGYSSLAYLRHLPVDTLKLDQSFVRHVDEDGPDHAIAAMVMGLGRTLGLKTVAEGIETTPQLRALQALGCDVGQGFLLGHPVPPEKFQLDPMPSGPSFAAVGTPRRHSQPRS